MNEKFYKNTKVEQLTNMFLSRGEEKGLAVKDPLRIKVCVGWKEMAQRKFQSHWKILKMAHWQISLSLKQ